MINNYKKLYKIIRANGTIKITPNAPSEDAEPVKVRLIASEGKAVTKDGTNLFICVDEPIMAGEGSIEERINATCEPWYEVDEPAEWRLRDE